MKEIIRQEPDKEFWINYIQNLNLKSPYLIEIKRISPKRNTDQNALYWCWVNFIAEETGNSPDDLHYYFKKRFLGAEKVTVLLNSKTYTSDKPKESKSLSEADFANFMDEVRLWANDFLGIVLLSINDPQWPIFYARYKR